jgi:4'-phosphopantetheinyl transferase
VRWYRRALTGTRSDVDVWLLRPEVDLPAEHAGIHALMDAEEVRRHQAFVFERHRREFLATRTLVRVVLASYRPVVPRAWRFRTNEYGRPAIEPPDRLRFNVANHPTLVALAVRDGAELGIDLEPVTRAGEILNVAEAAFAPEELIALRALPESERADRALSLWTLKESYIKARGMGLSLPLEAFAFTFDAPRPRISFVPPIADDPMRWQFRTVDCLGHRIALATEVTEPAPHVRIHHVVRIDPSGFESALL